tara:strand:- start:1136 stop:1666 length:531 start_codon:yes stop_codon:yes gene_type:complete
MKFLVLKFFIIFLYLITINLSYSIEPPDIKNIVIKKDFKSYENVVFKDINNEDINLEIFKGNLVILNFWATWCLPCIEEMPLLDSLQSNDSLDNLKILPINVSKENLKKIKSFYEKLDIKNLEIYYAPSTKIASKFSLRGIPTSILIDKNGKEFARIIGVIDFNDKKFINWLKKFD